jgi:hypothetical protein
MNKNLKDKLEKFKSSHFHKNFHVVEGDRTKEFIPKDLDIVAEVGVQSGGFSDTLLESTTKKLVLIDCWEEQTDCLYEFDGANKRDHESFYKIVCNKFKDDKRVKIIKDYSTALNSFPDNYFDLVYIDADHTYQICLNDLRMCNRVVKDTGYISGDDFKGWLRTPYNEIKDFSKVGKAFGVLSALYDFMEETDWKIWRVNNVEVNHNYILKNK